MNAIKVTMQSPEGETREVNASSPDLVPLMVQGWKQVPSKPAAVVSTPVQPDLMGKK